MLVDHHRDHYMTQSCFGVMKSGRELMFVQLRQNAKEFLGGNKCLSLITNI